MANLSITDDCSERTARVNKLKAAYKVPSDWREISDTRFIYLRLSNFMRAPASRPLFQPTPLRLRF